MRIRILTSCTGKKAIYHDSQLTLDDILRGEAHVVARAAVLEPYCRPAGELYTGAQHQQLMSGISTLRERRPAIDVDLWIVSAGFGLIPADRLIPPYNVSFTGMAKDDVHALAERLDLPYAARTLLHEPAECCLLLLGGSYFTALDLDRAMPITPPTVALCSAIQQLPSSVQRLTLTVADTKRFHQGHVGLKGVVAARILRSIADAPESLPAFLADPAGYLDWTLATAPA